jgi:Ca-activated chloride channel homolog
MASRKLIILSLFGALPVALLGETANDYAHHSAQDYIFGDEQEAKRELTAGLLKFPEDPELRDMLALFKDKQQDKDKDQDQKQQQQQQQGQQGQQQDQKDQQQQQSQNKADSGQNQNQEGKDQSAKNDQQKKEEPKAGETPSPSPGEEKKESQDRQSSPGDKQAEQSPTPGEGDDEPSPSPGEGDESGDNVGPSPSASASPQKKLAGELKEATDKKSEKAQKAEMATAEPEKEGELSERQAEALLQSMKDEEARVQLDERKASRHVYNDW